MLETALREIAQSEDQDIQQRLLQSLCQQEMPAVLVERLLEILEEGKEGCYEHA